MRSFLLLCATAAVVQASYAAQVRGVVKHQSGGMVPTATVTITNDATGLSATAHTDDHGLYILTGLRHRAWLNFNAFSHLRLTSERSKVYYELLLLLTFWCYQAYCR